MNDQDIVEFISAFEDFIKHAETEIDMYIKQQEAQQYMVSFYEQKAAELEITVDYYLAEFV